MDNIEIVKEKQEEMAEDIAKIKEAVYNPDSGIYARIRELESFKRSSVESLVDSHNNHNRFRNTPEF
jgi:hypothetical protein